MTQQVSNEALDALVAVQKQRDAYRTALERVVPQVQWLRGMCMDEEPYPQIDEQLAVLTQNIRRDLEKTRAA